MAGCMDVVACAKSLALPDWSNQAVTNPFPLATNVFNAVVSKSPPAVKPMFCVALSELLLTVITLPVYVELSLRKLYADAGIEVAVSPVLSSTFPDNLVTVIVYVLIVVPSCAVTFTSIVLLPIFNDNADDALPLVTVA